MPVTYRILFIYNAGVGVQHSDRPYPMFMAMPGLKIVAPTTRPTPRHAQVGDPRRRPGDRLRGHLPVGLRGPVADATMRSSRSGPPPSPPGEDVTWSASGRRSLRAGRRRASSRPRHVRGGHRPAVAGADRLADDLQLGREDRPAGRVDPAVRTCSAASEIVATVAEERYDALRAAPRRVASPRVHSPYTSVLERRSTRTPRRSPPRHMPPRQVGWSQSRCGFPNSQ